MFLLLLTACGARETAPLESEVAFEAPRVDGLRSDLADDGPLPAELAFSAREACPVITRARFVQDQPPMGALEIEGRSLERIGAMVAVMPDGKRGQAPPFIEGASRRFPVGCVDCELYFLFEVQGNRVACTGPGHSLQLQGGRLVAP